MQNNPTLPSTLEEAHTVIREMRGDAESLEQTGKIVGLRLGVTGQAGALLVILSRAGGRPLSPAQIEFRLPRINPDFIRGIKVVHVVVHTIRRKLGADAVITNGADKCTPGYSLNGEWLRRVRDASAD